MKSKNYLWHTLQCTSDKDYYSCSVIRSLWCSHIVWLPQIPEFVGEVIPTSDADDGKYWSRGVHNSLSTLCGVWCSTPLHNHYVQDYVIATVQWHKVMYINKPKPYFSAKGQGRQTSSDRSFINLQYICYDVETIINNRSLCAHVNINSEWSLLFRVRVNWKKM